MNDLLPNAPRPSRRGRSPGIGRWLRRVGVTPSQVFLLHEAFYDREGHALQPVPEGT